jgi:hypothetical protein
MMYKSANEKAVFLNLHRYKPGVSAPSDVNVSRQSIFRARWGGAG